MTVAELAALTNAEEVLLGKCYTSLLYPRLTITITSTNPALSSRLRRHQRNGPGHVPADQYV